MPKIPTYTSQLSTKSVKPTTQSARVMVNPEAFGMTGRAIAQFGETVSGVAERMYLLQAKDEVYKAGTKSQEFFSQNELDASQDPNTDGFVEKYKKQSDDEKQQILKDIKNPMARKQFQAEFDRYAISSDFRIKNIYNQRVIKNANENFIIEKERLKERFYNSPDIQGRQFIVATVKSRYDFLVSIGAKSPTLADAEFQEFKSDLALGQANHDIEVNPEFALNQLQKGNKGIYGNVPREKRAELIDDANNKIEKIQAQEEERMTIAVNQQQEDMLEKRNAGILTVEEVSLARENMIGLTEAKGLEVGRELEFYDAMIANLKSPKTVKAKTDPIAYGGIMEDILNLDISATKVQERILNENAQGKLSDADMKSLLYVGKLGQDPIFIQAQEEKNVNPFIKAFRVARDMIAKSFLKSADISVALMNSVIQRVQKENTPSEQIPQVTNEEINKESVRQFPEVSTFRDDGQLMVDSAGNKAMVYPDGSFKEVE